MSTTTNGITNLSAAACPSAPPTAREAKAAQKVSKDFEEILLHKLFEEMQKTVQESGLTEDAGTQPIQGMFWQFMAQDVAAKGGFGMAKQVYPQILKQIQSSGGVQPLPHTGQTVSVRNLSLPPAGGNP